MTDQPVTTDQPEREPLLRVVKGYPSPDELAALVAVVARRQAAAAATTSTANRTRSAWAANHRKLRRMPRPGPGAWQAAARPQ